MECATLCPVCGFELGFKAWDEELPSDEICECCGIQFGYTDHAAGDRNLRAQVHAEWREEWIRAGQPWRGVQSPPPGWNPQSQLEQLERCREPLEALGSEPKRKV